MPGNKCVEQLDPHAFQGFIAIYKQNIGLWDLRFQSIK